MNLSEVKSVLYKRITRTLADTGRLIPVNEDVSKYIKDDRDYYVSLYNYNEEHFKQFKETGTISGIEDVTTNVLLFDFDASEEKGSNFEDARQSSVKLVERLISRGVPDDSIQMFFSGNKGFHVAVDIEQTLTPPEFKNIVFGLAKDLKGFDERINNAARIIRIPLTKHDKSGLYKSPLTFEFLKDATEDDIRSYAIEPEKDVDLTAPRIALPASILSLKYPKKEERIKKDVADINMDLKPSWLSKCKYALSQGDFKSGMRNDALTCLAATYKAQGLPEEVVDGMIRGVANLQSSRNNEEPHSDQKINTLIRSVFKPTWNGGTFSCKKDGWLKDYCDQHGHNCNEESISDEPAFKNVKDILSNFKSYLENIDDNTIKTGIEELDKQLRLQTSTVVGILGSPASGKTTVALKMLRELNKSGRRAAFYSLDMGEPLIGQKLVQAVSNVSFDEVTRIYSTTERNLKKQLENDLITKEYFDQELKLIPEYRKKIKHWESLVEQQTENLDVSFESAINIDQMKKHILKQQEATGQKIWLVMVDYAECLSGPHADTTANMNLIFQKLKDMANSLQTCVVILLQPNKFAGDPGDVIDSYRQIKGASGIEQSCRVVIGIYREGYNPEKQEEDQFITLTVLKNNMGKLAKVDAGFDGEKGEIYKLDFGQKKDLVALRRRKASEQVEDKI